MKSLSLPRHLTDDLLLRWATPADDEQLIELAFHAHDEEDPDYPVVKRFTQDWADGKFPLLRHEDITVVEDTRTGKIVSSMCLFSEQWRYGQTPIQVGRPEMVMTHADYRRKGLVRAQFEVIHALSQQRQEVMQVITGIPSLYRYFGYELSLELSGGYRIYLPGFPKLPDAVADDYRLRRPESEADRTFVRQLHEANTRKMLFSIDADDAIWANEFDGYRDGSDGKSEWLLIEAKDGERLGYINHWHIIWGPTLNINFLALKPGVGYLNLLPHLLHGLWAVAQRKLVGGGFKQPTEEVSGLYFRLGRTHPLYDAIGRDQMLKAAPYAWYVRFPDEVAYLQAIQPQLERHLAQSVAAGYHGELKLNFYRSGAQLTFADGKISVQAWQPEDGSDGDVHFPANSFWSLLCGQRTAAELNASIADCFMSTKTSVLLDCLFPPFTGQVWVVGGGA
jgi:hypothetical protein